MDVHFSSLSLRNWKSTPEGELIAPGRCVGLCIQAEADTSNLFDALFVYKQSSSRIFERDLGRLAPCSMAM